VTSPWPRRYSVPETEAVADSSSRPRRLASQPCANTSFGGTTRPRAHWDVPLSWLGRCAVTQLRWRHAKPRLRARPTTPDLRAFRYAEQP
jgi:hypothetical protein